MSENEPRILLPEDEQPEQEGETIDAYPYAVKVIEYYKVLTEHRRAIANEKDEAKASLLEDIDPIAEEIAEFHDDYSETHIVEPPQIMLDKGNVVIVCMALRQDVAMNHAVGRATVQGTAQAIGQMAAQETARSASAPESGVQVAGATTMPPHGGQAQGGLRGLFGR